MGLRTSWGLSSKGRPTRQFWRSWRFKSATCPSLLVLQDTEQRGDHDRFGSSGGYGAFGPDGYAAKAQPPPVPTSLDISAGMKVRDAVIAMENNEPTKAATAFRRAKTVYARERQVGPCCCCRELHRMGSSQEDSVEFLVPQCGATQEIVAVILPGTVPPK